MDHNRIVQQDDHIILPKKTLMRFIDEKQWIYYLDLNDLNNISVKRIRPKSYHASPSYFNPEYDKKVQQCETNMGKLHKEISEAIDNNIDIHISAETLKDQIIDFLTIEFHRSVIADDAMLEKYKNQQQTENDKVDSMLFRTGRMTTARCDYSVNYRQKAKSKESFRYYAQNILGSRNQAILTCYRHFFPQILYIPSGSDYQFLLPQLNFVGNEQFACFILSPHIVLALYPELKDDSLILAVDRERVKVINLRVLECASVFDSGYREIVGEKTILEKMKWRIERIRSIATIEKNVIIIGDNVEFCLAEIDDVLEFVIILCLLSGTPNSISKVQMKIQNFDIEFFRSNQKEIMELFRKYSFELTMQ